MVPPQFRGLRRLPSDLYAAIAGAGRIHSYGRTPDVNVRPTGQCRAGYTLIFFLNIMKTIDSQHKETKRVGFKRLSILSLTIILSIACFLLRSLINNLERKSQISWNNDLATLMATSPNIAPPGDCGASLDCFAPYSVEKFTPSQIGTKLQVGYFTVTVLRAGRVEYQNNMLKEDQIFWAIDFELIYSGKGNSHYGGPAFESILQGKNEVFKLVTTEPEELFDVLEIKPGEKISGRLIYIVPSSESDLFWLYENRMTQDPILVFEVR